MHPSRFRSLLFASATALALARPEAWAAGAPLQPEPPAIALPVATASMPIS
jgi:hypothetical protein